MNNVCDIPEKDIEKMAEIYKNLPENIRIGWLMSGNMLLLSNKLREDGKEDQNEKD